MNMVFSMSDLSVQIARLSDPETRTEDGEKEAQVRLGVVRLWRRCWWVIKDFERERGREREIEGEKERKRGDREREREREREGGREGERGERERGEEKG